MNPAWRSLGINYLQYVNISARALRRVLKEDNLLLASRRDQMEIKGSKWSPTKPSDFADLPMITTRVKEAASH
ncbi:ATP synthase subunit epsilon, mitochondrial [Smittium mucronatum]|uniref:ATP synthase subunit epsilon, mitochondrial n=1 Tax=Smittium mucronatum TaxID=133383 RepID=A0A1R0GWZ2_9FUNG|nr:ATP synthase subunit epsilon, mitochondrial [Smittium mucronatum]